MKALLAACKPLILLDFHRSFNDTRTSPSVHMGTRVFLFGKVPLWTSVPSWTWTQFAFRARLFLLPFRPRLQRAVILPPRPAASCRSPVVNFSFGGSRFFSPVFLGCYGAKRSDLSFLFENLIWRTRAGVILLPLFLVFYADIMFCRNKFPIWISVNYDLSTEVTVF